MCLYNVAVDCDPDDRHCYNCAWNPIVDSERRQKTREKVLAEEKEKGDRMLVSPCGKV